MFRSAIRTDDDAVRGPTLVEEPPPEPTSIDPSFTTSSDSYVRIKTEGTLRASLAILRSAFEATSDGILVVDVTGRVVLQNKAYGAMWNVPREALLARDDERAVVHVLTQLVDPESFLETAREVFETPSKESRDVLSLKDGRYVECLSVPQRLGTHIVGRVWTFRDVTLSHCLELQRERRLREAQQALALRDEFLAVASHELNTPASSLLLAVHALEHGDAGDSPGTRRLVAIVRRQTQRLIQLVGSLLEDSKMLAGIQLVRERFDLVSLVGDVVEGLEQDLRRSGCAVVLRADRPVVGHWDRARLEGVVTNLLTNAVKFGTKCPIEIAVETVGDRARLVVRDHGIGIDKDLQDHIFERFGRGVSERDYKGLGLGLYICRRIAEAHDGTIRVESAPGEGATFIVEVPC